MPRGGKRKGAGRKSVWNTGKTKAVKLPESLIPGNSGVCQNGRLHFS